MSSSSINHNNSDVVSHDPSSVAAAAAALVSSFANNEQQQQHQQQQQQQGIDIRKAAEILAARASDSHSHPENNGGGSAGGGCTGCHGTAIPDEECKNMGQVIDIYEGLLEQELNNDGDADSAEVGGGGKMKSNTEKDDSVAAAKSLEEKKAKLDEERSKRLTSIEEKLRSMTASELLNAVLEAQQQRVAAYRTYDRGLEVALKSRNMTNYPQICAEATASFSVISDTINAIQKILIDEGRTDLKELVSNLQMHEKEKLNLTAALHLERIREQQQTDVEEGGEDKRISSLLKEGVKSLEGKVAACIEYINDDIEAIRCAVMDE